MKQLLALAVTVSTLATPAFAALFTDVQGHWAQPAITQLSQQGVLGGYPDGTFRPLGQITRAEFAATLVKALGMNATQRPAVASFADVPITHWSYPAVEAVKASGLINGYPGGLFKPAQNITRTEAMAILATAARVPMPTPAQADQILSRVPDQQEIPQWARRAVAGAIQANLVAQAPGTIQLMPLQPATRGDVAAMTQQLRVALNSPQQPLAQMNPNVQQQGTMLQGRVASVPAKTRFTGTLTTQVHSELSKVGDVVRVTVDRALVSPDGMTVVPVGSQIEGEIVALQPSGRVGKPAEVDIRFNEITTPNGQRISMEGAVATEQMRLMGGDTKGRIVKAAINTAIGAGAGAALGTAMGPLSGGKVGKGAIYGTAVGAGMGALATVAQKGKEVVVSQGDQLEIQLLQPITVEVGQR
jgi:hypothetical protein